MSSTKTSAEKSMQKQIDGMWADGKLTTENRTAISGRLDVLGDLFRRKPQITFPPKERPSLENVSADMLGGNASKRNGAVQRKGYKPNSKGSRKQNPRKRARH